MRLNYLIFCLLILFCLKVNAQHEHNHIIDTSIRCDQNLSTSLSNNLDKKSTNKSIFQKRKSPSTDSTTYIEKKEDSIRTSVKTSLSLTKNSISTQLKETDSSYKALINKEKKQLNNFKTTVFEYRDSLAKDSVPKDSLKKILKKEFNTRKKGVVANIRAFFKIDIKNNAGLQVDTSTNVSQYLNTHIKTEGSIKSESFATNYLQPIQPGEKTYTRLFGNTNVSLFNLPFNVEFYLTTERQTLYNANSFTLNFDSEQFKRNLRETAQRRMKEKTDLLYKNKDQLKVNDAELKNLDRQIASKEKTLNNQHKELVKLPGFKIPDTQLNPNQPLKTSIKDFNQNDNGSIDSLTTRGKNLIIDSLQSSTLPIDTILVDSNERNKLDSLKNEIKRMEEELENIEQKAIFIQKNCRLLKQSDSILNQEIIRLKQDNLNPKLIRSLINEDSPELKLIDNAISSIDNFNIGIFNPFYTYSSLWGITVKGLNLSWNGKNSFGKVTMGNTYQDQLSFNGFATKRPDFNRRIGAAMFGLGNYSKNHVYIIGMGLKDKPDNTPGIDRSSNALGGFGGQLKVKEVFSLKGEVLYSKYEKNTSPLYNTETPVFINDTLLYNPEVRNLSRMGFNATSSIFPNKNTELKTSWKWVGPAYRSLGSPYARTNFTEREIALKWKFFKNKISTNSFYRVNQTDPMKYRESNNKMSGFGVNLRTHFIKLPNIFLSYSPFEQGNNSPDTIFRSNNKFSLLTAGLSYRHIAPKLNLFTNIMFTRSHTEFRQLQNKIGNQYYFSVTQSIQYRQKITLNGLYAFSKTTPGIDTLNNYRIGSSLLYIFTNKLMAGLQYDGGFFKNGNYIQQGGMLLNYKWRKNFIINCKANIGKLKGVYGIDEIWRFEGLVGLEYRW